MVPSIVGSPRLEVALHWLGIHLSCVVFIKICEKHKLVLSSWWTKAQQTGRLIQKEDVQGLTIGVLEDLVEMVGGFDLIIGGLTCNNLPGKNGKDNGKAAKDSILLWVSSHCDGSEENDALKSLS